jgi:uncharacterized cupin superfamily protein
MSITTQRHVRDRIDAEPFEPFMVGDEQAGEVRWLRTEGSAGNALAAGLWRSEPATYDYVFPGDETFHVLEGAVTIELPETGETVELGAGDVASFDAGTRSVWRITKPFLKFTVVAG